MIPLFTFLNTAKARIVYLMWAFVLFGSEQIFLASFKNRSCTESFHYINVSNIKNRLRMEPI